MTWCFSSWGSIDTPRTGSLSLLSLLLSPFFACSFVRSFVRLFRSFVRSFVCFVSSFVRWMLFYQILSFSEKGRVSIRPLEVCKRRASGEEFAATWVDTRFGAPLRMTFVVGSTPPLRMPVENQGL